MATQLHDASHPLEFDVQKLKDLITAMEWLDDSSVPAAEDVHEACMLIMERMQQRGLQGPAAAAAFLMDDDGVHPTHRRVRWELLGNASNVRAAKFPWRKNGQGDRPACISEGALAFLFEHAELLKRAVGGTQKVLFEFLAGGSNIPNGEKPPKPIAWKAIQNKLRTYKISKQPEQCPQDHPGGAGPVSGCPDDIAVIVPGHDGRPAAYQQQIEQPPTILPAGQGVQAPCLGIPHEPSPPGFSQFSLAGYRPVDMPPDELETLMLGHLHVEQQPQDAEPAVRFPHELEDELVSGLSDLRLGNFSVPHTDSFSGIRGQAAHRLLNPEGWDESRSPDAAVASAEPGWLQSPHQAGQDLNGPPSTPAPQLASQQSFTSPAAPATSDARSRPAPSTGPHGSEDEGEGDEVVPAANTAALLQPSASRQPGPSTARPVHRALPFEGPQEATFPQLPKQEQEGQNALFETFLTIFGVSPEDACRFSALVGKTRSQSSCQGLEQLQSKVQELVRLVLQEAEQQQ